MSFNDKVVIVTGASSGIGAATAIQFAAEGAKVVIVGRQEAKLMNTSDKCEELGSKPLIVIADLTIDDDVKRIVSDTIAKYGKLDILVNNAGKGVFFSIVDENAVQMFDDVMAINLRSVVYLTNLTAPYLIETKGNIVNISSIASSGLIERNFTAYNVSKAGLDHFTKSIALELADKGVRVNAVNPGPVKSDIFLNMGMDKELEEIFLAKSAASTALGRVSESEEIADLVLFLASDKAKGITGSMYVVDNGKLLIGLTK